MIYPGEYPQPLQRVTNVQCPVVAGYITSRLQVQGYPINALSGYADNTTVVTVQNTGPADAAFFLLGTDDYISGPRENLVAVNAGTVAIVREGHRQLVVYPRHTYLEVKGFSGTSSLRMQFSSRLKWDELGFDRTDPYYPPGLYTVRTPTTAAVDVPAS